MPYRIVLPQSDEELARDIHETPCVSVCSTTIGDEVCQGCGRSTVEVGRWFEMTVEERARVWARVNADRGTIRYARLRARGLEREV